MTFHLKLTWLWFVGTSLGAVSTFDVTQPGRQLRDDPTYSGAVELEIGNHSGWVATLSGRNIGQDARNLERWGLTRGSFRGNPTLQIEQGLAPNAVGSTQHQFTSNGIVHQTDASYLSIRIQQSSQSVLRSLRLDLNVLNSSLATTAWAGTSADGFSSPSIPQRIGGASGGSRPIRLDLNNLNYSGAEPLEVRIYGIVGADTAVIQRVSLTLDYASIPETFVPLLWIIGAGLLLRRRR